MAAMSINTDMLSIVLQNNLRKTSRALSSSMEKLSTGRKINSAADGAAELSISTKLNSQISGTAVAKENVQHGMLMLNQADSGLQLINQNLGKIRDLAIQASNGTYSQAERDAMAAEAQGYAEQISNISKTTSFNGLQLLDGSLTDLKIQAGSNSSDALTITGAFTDASATALGLPPSAINSAFSSADNARAFINTIDNAITQTSSHLSTVGAYSNSLMSTLDNLTVKETNLVSANSLITDTDYAKEISNLLHLQILEQANISLLSQAGTRQAYALTLLQ